MNRAGAVVTHPKSIGLAFLLLTLVTGCAHSRGGQATVALGFKNWQLVYFQPEPYRRLYVEVDSVEGAEFSDTELGELEVVLRQWTQKPDGVSVVKSSLISRSVARGHSADSLARRYLDGPPATTNQSQPAYLYILVYDTRVNRNAVQSPRGVNLWPARDKVAPELAALENPRVVGFPYPAMIYLDRSWLGGLLPRKYWDRTLIHEAGHVLGLVSRESQVENHHCPTNWCVMNAHVSDNIRSDVVNWLKREKPKPTLCEACAQELRQYQISTNAVPIRFIGPALVRTMPSYSVVALPAFRSLYIGDSVDEEAAGFVDQFRKLQGPSYVGHVKNHPERESLQAIEAAKRDIDPVVRRAAEELERKLRGNDEQTTGEATE